MITSSTSVCPSYAWASGKPMIGKEKKSKTHNNILWFFLVKEMLSIYYILKALPIRPVGSMLLYFSEAACEWATSACEAKSPGREKFRREGPKISFTWAQGDITKGKVETVLANGMIEWPSCLLPLIWFRESLNDTASREPIQETKKRTVWITMC